MTSTILINGQEIELHEHPKHRAVQQVQDIMTGWMIDKIEMSSIDPGMPMEDAIKASLMRDPGLATEISSLQRTLPFDQTIMLATNMSYKELQGLTDEITEDEYRELYEASKLAIGGSADDFFGYYSSGMSGTQMTVQVDQIVDPSQLEISTNQL